MICSLYSDKSIPPKAFQIHTTDVWTGTKRQPQATTVNFHCNFSECLFPFSTRTHARAHTLVQFAITSRKCYEKKPTPTGWKSTNVHFLSSQETPNLQTRKEKKQTNAVNFSQLSPALFQIPRRCLSATTSDVSVLVSVATSESTLQWNENCVEWELGNTRSVSRCCGPQRSRLRTTQ